MRFDFKIENLRLRNQERITYQFEIYEHIKKIGSQKTFKHATDFQNFRQSHELGTCHYLRPIAN